MNNKTKMENRRKMKDIIILDLNLWNLITDCPNYGSRTTKWTTIIGLI